MLSKLNVFTGFQAWKASRKESEDIVPEEKSTPDRQSLKDGRMNDESPYKPREMNTGMDLELQGTETSSGNYAKIVGCFSADMKEEFPSPNQPRASKHNSNFDKLRAITPPATSPCDPFVSHPYRHLIHGPSITKEKFKSYLLYAMDGLQYSSRINLNDSGRYKLKNREKRLRDHADGFAKKKTLALDLEETLLHIVKEFEGEVASEGTIDVSFRDGTRSLTIKVKLRPYLQEFLQTVSEFYEVVIFTACTAKMAHVLVDVFDPERKIITDILTREECVHDSQSGFFIKELSVMKNRDIKDIIIIDNYVHSFALNIPNGIPILAWTTDPKDLELKHLPKFLLEASEAMDVRQFLTSNLKLSELM